MALALRHYYSYSGRTEKPHKKSSTFKQEQFAENQPQISSKMVAAMSFTTVNNVMDSWEDVRRIENYDEVVGVALFEKLFEIDPTAIKVFDCTDNPNFKSKRLVRHAKHFVLMLDRAVDLLGPDIELLTEILLELGGKHVVYGVKASHYDPMGRALISTLQEILGDRFTQQQKDSWLEVYQALTYDMRSMYGCGCDRTEELFSTATIVTEASCLF